jgi:glutathione peroxidase
METILYTLIVTNIEGATIPLSDFRDKVIMIVNVASKCGFTPQYEQLEALYQKYREKGFVILGFPANDFLGQEPASDKEILQFCSLNYNVTFPMFSKIHVKGIEIAPLYQYLSDKKLNPETGGEIPWNFTKILVDRSGKPVRRFEPKVKPDDPEVISEIERLLSMSNQ